MLLSGFELRRDGQVVELPLSVQRVLAFLALHERRLQRIFVSGSLWANSNEARANASLRTVLWRLHQPGLAGTVTATAQHVALAPDVQVDVREATYCARQVLDKGPVETVDFRLLAYGGDLLPDWYDDWVLLERERLRQLRLHALEALCRSLTLAGRLAEAVEVGLAAVADEPLRESAHRALMETHIADGNVGEAVRQYRMYQTMLREQLGLEPSPGLQAFMQSLAIRDG